jgi:predicted lipoprotein with Yx(FWY)xxD motif
MKTKFALIVATGLALAGSAAFAAKACEELKTEIAAKLDAKKVTGYTLDVVEASDKAADDKQAAKVVGTCEGGAKKIVYSKK